MFHSDDCTKGNGIKLVNPVSLGILYFSFALALWSSGQISSKPVVGIAVFSSLVSIAFFVAVFSQTVLEVLSKWVVTLLAFVSFIAFVSGFVIRWLQSVSRVSGVALEVVFYLGFAWIVVFLLVVTRDTKLPTKIQNRAFLFIYNRIPYIVVLVFFVLAIVEFINHDFWSGGFAVAIAGLSLSVTRGRLTVLGNVFEQRTEDS